MGYELLAAAVIEKALQDYKAALITKNKFRYLSPNRNISKGGICCGSQPQRRNL